MVFQNYALFPHMSVRQNIGFGLKMRGVAAGRGRPARRREALALVRLARPGRQAAGPAVRRPAAARRHRPRHRHRAAAGADGRAAVQPRRQAAAGNARGNPPHPRRPRRRPRSTSRTTRTRRCRSPTASSCMRDGEIRQVGTPEDLYRAPGHLDVAEFMGFRNRIAGTYVRQYDGDDRHHASSVGRCACIAGQCRDRRSPVGVAADCRHPARRPAWPAETGMALPATVETMRVSRPRIRRLGARRRRHRAGLPLRPAGCDGRRSS